MRILILSVSLALSVIACGDSSESNSKADKKANRNPKLVVEWSGHLNNNTIKLINIDSTFQASELMQYAKNAHKQSKAYQNIHLFFYNGNAPESIPIPELQKTDPDNPKTTGLNGVMEFVKSSKPVQTITIIGDGEYEIHQGFSY